MGLLFGMGCSIPLAVVLIVTVAVPCVPDLTTIGEVGALQVALVGAPSQVSPTLNWSLGAPPLTATCKVYVAVCPAVIVADGEPVTVSEKSMLLPAPVRLTDCWLLATFPALSVIVTEALRAPEAVGVNVTLIAQFDPAARLVPQVFVCEKSPALAPVIPMELMERAAPPSFVSVNICGLLAVPIPCAAKAKLATFKLAPGAAPIPVKLTVCGLLLALSVIVTEAVRVPAAVGLNATFIAQFAPATRLVPQVLVCE
jgi:hypothetical protein